jgi:AraC family transcriptional regulator
VGRWHIIGQVAVTDDRPHSPVMYLSSSGAGWRGLVAQAFHEPRELEAWVAPAMPDTSLILLRGGAIRMEQRQGHGSWRASNVRHRDLILRPASSPSREVRWRSLTPTPTRTLHLRLAQDLLPSGRQPLTERPPFRDSLLAEIGFAVWRELEQGSPSGRLYAETAAQMLAAHLLRHHAGGPAGRESAPRGLTPRQVKRVAEFVLAHLDRDVSLQALAGQTGLSPSHFARSFRRTVGESPHQFVLRQRVERAQRLLEETDLPLAQVAMESGFAHQSHLTRVFGHRLGLTPAAYRRTFLQ